VNVALRRTCVVAVIFVVATLGVIISNLDVIDDADSRAWWVVAVVSGFVGTAVTSACWWFNDTSGRAPIRTRVAIVESVLIGAAYGATQVIMAAILDLSSERDPALTFISTVLGIAILGPAVVLLMRGRHVEEARRAELLEQGIAVSAARKDVVDLVQRMQLALDSDIDQTLTSARKGFEEQLTDQETAMSQEHWPTIALALRSAAHDSIRPLSRRLWFRTPLPAQRMSIRLILRNILTKQPFQLPSLMLIYVLTAFAGAVTNLGWPVGLLTIGVGVGLIGIVLGGGNALMSRSPHRHAVIFIAAALVLQLTSLLAFPVRAQWGAVPYTWTEFILAVIASVLLILLTSAVGSVGNYRDDVARTFRSDVDQEFLASVAASRHIAQIARESARTLHGTVQTRLIVCAVAIERATEQQDVESFQRALHEAYEVLARPRQDSHAETTVAVEVERKVGLWSGLCDITVEIDPAVRQVDGRTARDVGRVVEEGLSNAIKHGEATWIAVFVRVESDRVLVEVIDDGHGISGGKPGLGSALLDTSCHSWSIRDTGQGAHLRAVVRAGL